MYSYYAPLDIKTSFALAQLRWRINQPLGLKVHSSQVFTVDQSVGISLKCILTNFELSASSLLQGSMLQS